MNTRLWEKLAKEYLLPHLPDFSLSGRWLFYAPIGWQVRGFLFEPSGWDKQRFTIETCVMPLYVPATAGLTFSARLGFLARNKSDIWWSVEKENAALIFADIKQRILHDGLPYLSQRSTVRWMTKLKHASLSDENYVHQAMLCAGIVLNDANIVNREWQQITAYYRKNYSADSAVWFRELYRSTELIYQRYTENPVVLREEIVRWRHERAEELRFDKFLAEEPSDLQ